MVIVIRQKGETADNLFRRFSKMAKEENIVFEVTRKMFYKKPSLARKEKEKDRLKRLAQERKLKEKIG